MILATGASGTNGREVIQSLSQKGTTVRAMTRQPGRASGALSVEWTAHSW
jgi:uncharacterized protein YbjT (DUF2867 family)